MVPTSTTIPSDLAAKLQELSDNQSKWTNLSYTAKLAYLETLNSNVTTLPLEDWQQLGEWTAGTMMGIVFDFMGDRGHDTIFFGEQK